jgi:hypothetical protein
MLPKKRKANENEDVKLNNKKEKLENGGIEDVDEPVWCLKKAQEEKPSRQCPYLDTIDR